MKKITIPAALIWSCYIGLGTAVAQPETDLERARDIGRTLAGYAINEVEEDASGRGKQGILVAEGDSWFDYPRSDVLTELSKIGYDVVSVAERGDTAENMIYGSGSLVELAEKLEFLRRKNLNPVGILLSAGGNDLAGPELAMLLNHRQSGFEPYDADVINLVVHRRLQSAMISLLSAVDTLRARYFPDQEIPILIHGYDCPVPDGRGFLGGLWFLPGPWLDPSLRRKGVIEDDGDLAGGTELMCRLIEEFNAMVSNLPRQAAVPNVRYVPLVGTLKRDQDYKKWWGNELHATRKGLQKIARRFHEALQPPEE